MIPWLLNPAATYRPATAPVSPRQNAASGVNDSGAFRNLAYSTPRSAGTRSSASRRTGAKCSQSGLELAERPVRPAASAGSSGLPSGSKAPTSSAPFACRR